MFADYVKKLSAVKKLRPDEERALWRAYKERGNEAARRRIIESYQPLVFREVMPYRALPAVMPSVLVRMASTFADSSLTTPAMRLNCSPA